MVDTTWTNGGGDGKASTAANWSNGIDVGYNVIFDGTSTANCTFDYDGELGAFTIAAGYSGTITQASDMHITGYSQAGGTFTGIKTKWVYDSGNWTLIGGIQTNYLIQLELTGSSKTITAEMVYFHNLKISGSITQISNLGINSVTAGWHLEVTPTGHYTINNGKTFYYMIYSTTGLLVNNGIIDGPGTFRYAIYENSNLVINNISNVMIIMMSTGGSKISTITSNVVVDTLLMYSNHATYTCTLDLNGHSLTATTITVGTRGILTNSAATDSVVSCASFDSSAGTFTEANTQVILKENGTLKTGAHKFDELVQRDNVITTLASNVTVTNEFDTAGSFVQGAYSITHENPGKRLMAPMINPIIRNPKRSPFLNNRFTKNIEIEVV